MKNIWHELPSPFFCLAPMQNVTNKVFRQRIAALAKPDLMFTEFIPVEGLISQGHKRVAQSLAYEPQEQPLIAQIWGTDPDKFYESAKHVVELGFAGVDINFGCPDKAVLKKGACSAMIKTPNLALELIQATKEGVAGKIPISVKTRIGFDEIVTESWTETLLSADIVALTLHARTTAELSKVPAHWDEFGKAVAVRDSMGVNTLMVGNGDIVSVPQGREIAAQYNLDGIMIARGIFHNPWLFDESADFKTLPVKTKILAFKEHIDLFVETYGSGRGYERMKKLVKMYVSGFRGAKRLKNDLLLSDTFDEFMHVLNAAIVKWCD